MIEKLEGLAGWGNWSGKVSGNRWGVCVCVLLCKGLEMRGSQISGIRKLCPSSLD